MNLLCNSCWRVGEFACRINHIVKNKAARNLLLLFLIIAIPTVGGCRHVIPAAISSGSDHSLQYDILCHGVVQAEGKMLHDPQPHGH